MLLECWALKNEDGKKLHMICLKTLRDAISNQAIPTMTGMEKIEVFTKASRNYEGSGMWIGWMMKEFQ